MISSVLINQGLPSIAFAAIITYLSIPWIEILSEKFNWVVGKKRAVSIFGGAMIASGCLVSWTIHHSFNLFSIGVIISVLMCMVLGLLEDKYLLKGVERFFIQSLAVSIMMACGGLISKWQWAFFNIEGDLGIFSWIITYVMAMIGLNSVVVLRRLDGLLCLYVGIVAFVFGICSLFFKQINMFIFGMSLLGTCFSFYKYNRKPLRIYLGRSGIYVMGMALNIMAIKGVMQDTISSNIIIVLFLYGIPLICLVFQLPLVMKRSRKRVRSFSIRNKRLNRHSLSRKIVLLSSIILILSSAVVLTCLNLKIPLLMILIFFGGAIYGGIVTGIWLIPTAYIKRFLVCFRY